MGYKPKLGEGMETKGITAKNDNIFKRSVSSIGWNAKELYQESIMKKMGEKGNVAAIIMIGVVAAPVCAYFGSYLGQGIGWLSGQLVDAIPYVNRAAPWLAERCGHIGQDLSSHELNVQLYATTGAISGFWGGLLLPVKAIAKYLKD